MPFKKGQEKKGGRAEGSQNKLTKTVKDTVLAVFNDLQADPKANLLSWAKGEPTEFYKIAAKLIPTEVNATVQQKVVNVKVPGETNEE
jgi:hypothetical protein